MKENEMLLNDPRLIDNQYLFKRPILWEFSGWVWLLALLARIKWACNYRQDTSSDEN